MFNGDGDSNERVRGLLAAAEAGDSAALGELLEVFRGYLTSIAREEIGGQLGAKVSPSDVVQDVFMDACRCFTRFQGSQSAEFRGWLRAILLNRLRDLYKHYFEAQNRNAGLERSMDDSRGGAGPLRRELVGSDLTPSKHLARNEEATQLTAAMNRLAEQSRQVIVWNASGGNYIASA
ncbi:MAG TPA: sigma factor, partial [Pirellulaceae bacterium]|nr:sigma factor [Pirellulaceae bacterium]